MESRSIPVFFAVQKSKDEDRWISPLEFANDSVDDQLLPKMVAPYIPQLSCTAAIAQRTTECAADRA